MAGERWMFLRRYVGVVGSESRRMAGYSRDGDSCAALLGLVRPKLEGERVWAR